MPDWTYHPFFRPLLFQLPAEVGRRLTLKLLSLQGRTSLGRTVFRLFGHVHAPPEVAVELFGLTFPSPVGMAAGIDTHATAVNVMGYLGFGFLELGPAEATARAPAHNTRPARWEAIAGIAQSHVSAAPAAADVARSIAAMPSRQGPVGVAVRSRVDVAGAVAAAATEADFITLDLLATHDLERLRAARAATEKPLLARISAAWSDEGIEDACRRIEAAELDGIVLSGERPTGELPEGSLHTPAIRERALEVIAQLRALSDLPIIAAAGVHAPEDAARCLEAGANLVSLYEGLVYAGPGLPGRIVAHLAKTRARADDASPPRLAPVDDSVGPPPRWAAVGISFTGIVLLLTGLFAFYLAATDHMLPPDVDFLGMTAAQLCRFEGCRIVNFMVHDRVSFGGSIMAVGILYWWLGAVPLRRGETWSFWALALSGLIGFGSFLTYLGHGYLDKWHGMATLLLLPVFLVSLLASYRGCSAGRLGALKTLPSPAYRWSPAGRARLALGFAAFGMISGGMLIMGVGMSYVFVPQDLEYMQLTAATLDAINPRLVALIAHDRAGFGGGLASGGIVVMSLVFYGIRPGAPGLWCAITTAGLSGFGTAIGIHFVVGYTSFIHLLPAYAGLLAFLYATAVLFRPMVFGDPHAPFSDY